MSWYNEIFGSDYLKIDNKINKSGKDEVLKIIKILKMKKGSKVLDLGCGLGRHTIPLSKLGYKVVGVDISDYLLDIAKEASEGLPIIYENKDMRFIDYNKEFDVVLNLSTSFGYFEDDKDNYKVLENVNRALKPGGKFLIEFHSPSCVKRNYQSYCENEVDGETIITKSKIDNNTLRNEVTVKGTDYERTYNQVIKLYDTDWFDKMTKKCGLIIDEIYCDFDKNPYNPLASKRMVIVGRSKKTLLSVFTAKSKK